MSEPTALKIFEHAYYIGNYVGGVLWGVNLIVYVFIMRSLFDGRNASSKKRFHAVFATNLIVMLAMEAVIATFWGDQMWIVARDNIAAVGVPGWILTRNNVWYAILRIACGDATAAVADAFLLYRLYTIYGSSYAVVVFPSIIYLASIAIGVVQVVSVAGGDFWNGGDFSHGNPVDWYQVYFTLTVAFNFLVTILILVRLRIASKVVREITGRDSAIVYGTIFAMVIESAAIYAGFTITFLIIYSIGSPVSVGFGNAAGKVTCLAQLLIILRVANRTAWSQNTMTAGSQSHGMQFASGATVTSIATTQAIQVNRRSTSNPPDAIDKQAWNDSEGRIV